MTQSGGMYLPLWYAPKAAITAYLYCPQKLINKEKIQTPFSLSTVGLSESEIFSEDMKSIKVVMEELHAMAQSGRQFFVICPVHYQTLKKERFFLEYIGQCRKIPEERRRYLIFMLTDIPDNISQLDVKRCVSALKKAAYRVYGQIESSGDMNLHVLKDGGLDAIGFCLDSGMEEKILLKLIEFEAKSAIGSGLQNLFLLNVSTLSLATSAICSFYTYLGGMTIHKFVKNPEYIIRFKNEDLFNDLLKSQESNSGKADNV